MANRGPNRWTGQGTGDNVSNIEHLAGDDGDDQGLQGYRGSDDAVMGSITKK
jgi:hypothetical protein